MIILYCFHSISSGYLAWSHHQEAVLKLVSKSTSLQMLSSQRLSWLTFQSCQPCCQDCLKAHSKWSKANQMNMCIVNQPNATVGKQSLSFVYVTRKFDLLYCTELWKISGAILVIYTYIIPSYAAWKNQCLTSATFSERFMTAENAHGI